jgi:hypothetical protein
MKTLAKSLAAVAILFAALPVVAGKSVHDLYDYSRAAVEETVECVTDGLPSEVRDKKLANDMASIRAELLERRVKLGLAMRQIERLRSEVAVLTDRTERDRRLLVEAYPLLEEATQGRRQSSSARSTTSWRGETSTWRSWPSNERAWRGLRANTSKPSSPWPGPSVPSRPPSAISNS